MPMHLLRWLLFLGLVCCLFIGGAALGGWGTETFENLDAYERFVEASDSPYVERVSREGVEVSARYLPTTAMLLPQIRQYREERARLAADTALTAKARRSKGKAARQTLAERRKAYARSIYVRLVITPEKEGEDLVFSRLKRQGFGAYGDWLRTLLFGLREQTRLETPAGDAVPPALFHMERNYGMSEGRTFLVAFPATFNGKGLRSENELQFEIEEFGLGTGTLSFKLDLAEQARLASPA